MVEERDEDTTAQRAEFRQEPAGQQPLRQLCTVCCTLGTEQGGPHRSKRKWALVMGHSLLSGCQG